MSSKRFTPGPYVIEQTLRGVKIIRNRGASESYPICTMARNQQTTENAYLLSAAPEMFEALKSASIALDMVRGSTFCETCDDEENGQDWRKLIRIKMDFNKTRPYRHGGKVC